MTRHKQPIGLFDSGVGGLTVLKALKNVLPNEDFIYLGDTARVPYGNRSPETIIKYSSDIVEHLLTFNIKSVVVACNTASSFAIPRLKQMCNEVPVFGVIEPGSEAAVNQTHTKVIGVLGTQGTVQGKKYLHCIQEIAPDISVVQQPCPLFVPLIEEGWINDSITDQVIRRYLDELLNRPGAEKLDTIILGCTHYPMIAERIRQMLPTTTIIDSANATAQAVEQQLRQKNRLCLENDVESHVHYLVTDHPERFTAVGKLFLGTEPRPLDRIDL